MVVLPVHGVPVISMTRFMVVCWCVLVVIGFAFFVCGGLGREVGFFYTF